MEPKKKCWPPLAPAWVLLLSVTNSFWTPAVSTQMWQMCIKASRCHTSPGQKSRYSTKTCKSAHLRPQKCFNLRKKKMKIRYVELVTNFVAMFTWRYKATTKFQRNWGELPKRQYWQSLLHYISPQFSFWSWETPSRLLCVIINHYEGLCWTTVCRLLCKVYTVYAPGFQGLAPIRPWTVSNIGYRLHHTQSQRHFEHHQPWASWVCDLNNATKDKTTKNIMITSDQEKPNCDKKLVIP